MLLNRIAALSLISAVISAAAINSRQLDDINDSVSSALGVYNGGNQPKQQDTTQQATDTKNNTDANKSSNEETTPADPNDIDWKKVHQIAHAKFTDKVKGTVKFGGSWKEPTDVEIIIEEGLEEHKEYKYSINVHPIDNGDCNTAGDIRG